MVQPCENWGMLKIGRMEEGKQGKRSRQLYIAMQSHATDMSTMGKVG